MNEFTLKEIEIINDARLRENQLRNIRLVMNSSITPKKLKQMQEKVLPGYIIRNFNAQQKIQAVMEKHHLTRVA